MKNIFLKKITAILIAVAMVFTMAGCGKGSKQENGNAAENVDVPEMKEMVFEGKPMMFSGVADPIVSFIYRGDKIYFTTQLYILDENVDKEHEEELSGTTITGFYIADTDGKNVKEIKTIEWGEKEFLSSWEVTEDGSIIYVTGKLDGQKGTYSVSKMGADGTEIFKEEVTKASNLNTADDRNVSIALDKNENIILVSENGAFLFDKAVKFVDRVKPEGTMNGQVAKTKAGDIICGSSDGEGFFARLLDVEKKCWGKQYELEALQGRNGIWLMNGAESDFYYSDESGIYGFDLAKGKAEKLVDYMASNMTEGDTNRIYPVEKEKLMGMATEGAQNKLVVYKKVDPSTVQERKKIVLGGYSIDEEVKAQAAFFNKENKNYMIEIKDYFDGEDAVGKMNADMIAGHVPDILYLNNAPLEMYASKGMLEDLTSYYEKDTELSTEDIIPGVLEGMKMDSKICFVSPTFSIATLVGKTEDVGSKMGWTYQDMQKALEKKGNNVRPFVSESNVEMLYELSSVYNDFIDWNTGKCDFDSKEFKEILETIHTGREIDESPDEIPCYYGDVKDGKVLLASTYTNLDQMQVFESLFESDFTFVGYPCKEKTGSYFAFNSMLGMSSTSEVKDGVWEFIRTFMRKEYQDAYSNLQDVTRADSFEGFVEKKMQPNFYSEQYCDSTGSWWDYYIELEPVTKKQVEKYKELINHTKKPLQQNTTIVDIILEECQPYFAGDKDVDETAKIIQNRVTTYVNEVK